MGDATIDGVKLRPLEKNVDDRGSLTEIFRRDWEQFFDEKPAMSYVSVTKPSAVRTWHRHSEGHVDYFVVLRGRLVVAVYDDREDSATKGAVNEFVLDGENLELLRVPGDCWHGVKCVGENPSIHIGFPTKLYDYEDPDKERKDPFDNDIPYDWNEMGQA